jgi:hypothetical protein
LAPFLAGGVVLIESSAGWIGAALGGLAYLALMVALGTGTTPAHERSYWGCVLGIELLAVAVLAALEYLAQLRSWPRGSGVLIAVLAFGLLAAACSLSSRCQRKPIGFVLPKMLYFNYICRLIFSGFFVASRVEITDREFAPR